MPVAHVNGTDLYYLETGQGIPCLVMHGGFGLDHTYLHPALDPLGTILRLAFYDHRGHGRSGRPPIETLTFESLCTDADELRKALGHEKTAVFGHSAGGFVALHYALRFPQHLSHLILADTAPAWNFSQEIRANRQRKGETEEIRAAWSTPILNDSDLERFWTVAAPQFFHSFNRELFRSLFGGVIYTAPAHARGGDLFLEHDVTEHLGEIHVPTLILAGRDDIVSPLSQAEIMHRGIPNSRLVVFERSGHFPFAEEPDAFLETVRTWFSETASRLPG